VISLVEGLYPLFADDGQWASAFRGGVDNVSQRAWGAGLPDMKAVALAKPQ
jgi:hypothetical protein